MNILEKIIEHKKLEVAKQKKLMPVDNLDKLPFYNRATVSLQRFVTDEKRTGIIAEFKRQSPSKGIINDRDSVEAVTKAYADFGASGISILTDTPFFGGSLDDLQCARDNNVPLLRKDFMIDEYQVIEAKAYGADVVLLIAACLSPKEIKQLASTANNLGLEVLLELHEESELGHICESVHLVGVNNRNLRSFEVNLEHSINMAGKIGNEFVKIAESGIDSTDTIRYLKNNGFHGFLIGEYFMKQENPMDAFKEFAQQI